MPWTQRVGKDLLGLKQCYGQVPVASLDAGSTRAITSDGCLCAVVLMNALAFIAHCSSASITFLQTSTISPTVRLTGS